MDILDHAKKPDWVPRMIENEKLPVTFTSYNELKRYYKVLEQAHETNKEIERAVSRSERGDGTGSKKRKREKEDGKGKKQAPKCTICGKRGHTADECWHKKKTDNRGSTGKKYSKVMHADKEKAKEVFALADKLAERRMQREAKARKEAKTKKRKEAIYHIESDTESNSTSDAEEEAHCLGKIAKGSDTKPNEKEEGEGHSMSSASETESEYEGKRTKCSQSNSNTPTLTCYHFYYKKRTSDEKSERKSSKRKRSSSESSKITSSNKKGFSDRARSQDCNPFINDRFKEKVNKKVHYSGKIIVEIKDHHGETVPIRALLDTGTSSTMILRNFVAKGRAKSHKGQRITWKTLGGVFSTRRKALLDLFFSRTKYPKESHVDLSCRR